jgi:hypothetical protein
MKKYFNMSILVIISSIWLLLGIVPIKSEQVQQLQQVRQLQDIQAAGAHKGTLRPDINFGKIPLYFVANQGQVNEKALFYSKASRYTLWLTKEGLVFDSTHSTPVGHPSEERHTPLFGYPSQEGNYESLYLQLPTKIERDVSRLFFLNANKNPEMVPVEETKLRVNYFKGKNKSQWHCDISTSQAVLYKNLYKDIDLKVYGIEKEIEYDWIVKPGGNPKDIRFKYKNVKGTRLDEEGNLLIKTDFGELMHKKPMSYQKRKAQSTERKAQSKGVGAGLRACPDGREDIVVKFKKISISTYGFEVGEYDKSRELIIDPVVLVYSTYLGGSHNDWGLGIAVDGSSCAYVTGQTQSSDFPTLNEYQAELGGDYDVFITKLDTTKSGFSSLIYSTYLEGDDNEGGFGITVDSSGCAYVTGYTYSPNFPTMNAYQAELRGDRDIFITKLDTTKSGSSSLIYSTYLGGNGNEWVRKIAVDGRGCAYVAGETDSWNFPTLNQYQGVLRGAVDAFITKLDTTKSGFSSLIYSTYLGGKYTDYGLGITVDGSGCTYVTGETFSSDFPTLNQYQADLYGDYDVFITKLDTTKSGFSSLIYSTYLGGGGHESGKGIAVDGSGCAYVTGYTTSSDFPTLNEYQGELYRDTDVFLAKLDTTKNGASSLVYSTYLGGERWDFADGIALDDSGCAYVTGGTASWDFPILNQYQVYQGLYSFCDVFITKLDTTKNGSSSLIYSTYLGGCYSEWGRGIAVDGSGCAYVTGYTNSSAFPILNQYQEHPKNYYYNYTDVFITKIVLCTESPSIQLNRASLYFRALKGGPQTGSQTFSVDISGECSLLWTASGDESWIKVTPKSAAGSALATVSVDTSRLAPGNYTGAVFIIYGSVSDSVTVNLTIYDAASTSVPFGEFSTPLDASVARGSIPVTGWVLDDMEVESVKIYRDNSIYVGDAVFVDGARPDVETAFPDYPFNYRAGWGYMLLTNFFPDGGNGTYTLSASATDVEGNTVTLGTKTIICDNDNAVKPFGTIDTPAQGGTASSPGYINWGWVLTPQPNSIPFDGSTIHVWVDGVNLGNPVYNIFRSDIASLFLGYTNSGGAAGYFQLDTTAYPNGVHSIQWTVTDSGGNTDGIGSRYFTILNAGSTKQSSTHNISQNPKRYSASSSQFPVGALERRIQEYPFTCFASIPVDPEPVWVKTGFDNEVPLQTISQDDSDIINIIIPQAARVEIHLWPVNTSNNGYTAGFQVVANRLRTLPPGSTLDKGKGVFYWQPGPALIGSYDFLFVSSDTLEAAKKIRIIIQKG